VPLTKLQTDLLEILAAQRDPESYVAGATPLNRNVPRYSGDIDLFHDREERVALAALTDETRLEAAGYEVKWLRQLPAIYSAKVTRGGESTRLEWVADSDFRFFPTMRDRTFGYVLHPVDLALNKVMAAAGRREVRDLVDLLTIHERILSLGGAIWAAVEKSPGFTPEGLIAEIRRNANYPIAEWRSLLTETPLDPDHVMMQLRTGLNEAETFVMQMPNGKKGLLFLENGEVVQPDPARLDTYQTHAGERRGHWPSSPEISAAMFERMAEDSAYK
jgi:hypothetical protein